MTRSTRILLQIIVVCNGLFLIGLIGSTVMYLRLLVAPITPDGAFHDYTSPSLTAAVIVVLLAVETVLIRMLRNERTARNGGAERTAGGSAGPR